MSPFHAHNFSFHISNSARRVLVFSHRLRGPTRAAISRATRGGWLRLGRKTASRLTGQHGFFKRFNSSILIHQSIRGIDLLKLLMPTVSPCWRSYRYTSAETDKSSGNATARSPQSQLAFSDAHKRSVHPVGKVTLGDWLRSEIDIVHKFFTSSFSNRPSEFRHQHAVSEAGIERSESEMCDSDVYNRRNSDKPMNVNYWSIRHMRKQFAQLTSMHGFLSGKYTGVAGVVKP
jgi:hypothetical protein